MTRKNLPIAFYLLLVFVSGSVVGALGYRTYNPPTARGSVAPPPGEWRRNYINESRTRLRLTEDQVAKLTVLLDQTEARYREAREHENQAIGKIREEHVERVRTILTPEQLPEYEKLHQEREERAKRQEQQRR